MLMTVALRTDAFHYEGAHQQGVGRDGTILEFHIILEPASPPRPLGQVVERLGGLLWKATVDIRNAPADERAKPQKSSDYRAQAFGRNPIETLDKLADNLRRVADALDQSLEGGILVPIKLHRKKNAPDRDRDPEPGTESLDDVLASGDS